MSNCRNFLHSIRIKNQVFIIQLVSFGILELILIIIFLLNRNEIQNIITDSTSMVQKRLIIRQIDTYSNLLEHQIKQQFKEKELELIAMGDIYCFIDRQKNAYFEESLLIPSPSQAHAEQFNYNSFPYFFYTQQNAVNITEVPNDLESRNIVEFSKILNWLLFPIRTYKWYDSKGFYTSVLANQFYSMSPITFRNESYKPHERIWYLTHLEAIKNRNISLTITDPYLSFSTGRLQSSITYSLMNNKKELEGVVTTNYILLQLDLLSSFKFMNIVLATLYGQIVAADLQLLQKANRNIKIFFYSQQITGFNHDDWIEIKNQYLYKNGTSNCIETLNKFCRYNVRSQSNTYISIYLMQNKFYLITLSNSNYLQQVNNQTQIVINNITYQIEIFIILFVISVFIFLIFTYVIIQIYLKPLQQINNFLRYQVDPLSVFKQKQIFSKNSLFYQVNLSQFYDKITNKIQVKNQECLNFESFLYPKNNYLQNFDTMNGIKNIQLTYLQNDVKQQQFSLELFYKYDYQLEMMKY